MAQSGEASNACYLEHFRHGIQGTAKNISAPFRQAEKAALEALTAGHHRRRRPQPAWVLPGRALSTAVAIPPPPERLAGTAISHHVGPGGIFVRWPARLVWLLMILRIVPA
jgi:hypothetical protein